MEPGNVSSSLTTKLKNILTIHTHSWGAEKRVFVRIAPKRYKLITRQTCDCGATKDKEEK